MPWFHRRQRSGALRRVPSPEQGTSQRMRSNWMPCPLGCLADLSPGNFCASWLVTRRQGEHMRLVWWTRRWQRCASASLATTIPEGSLYMLPWWSISRSWNVLEPGAAHMSSTVLSGLTSRKNGGTMDTVSWRVMVPVVFSRLMNSKISFRMGTVRSCLREKFMCHASSSGYHGIGRGFSTVSPSSSIVSPWNFEKKSVFILSRTCAAYFPLPLMRKVVGRGVRRIAMNSFHSASGTILQFL
mmetsp:Transcript_31227/g.99591  ORF Transcript_31227/g.99591 Transcript_31227/m.99591 type:complete len:242 (-) Transcript_31227:201-926(-)